MIKKSILVCALFLVLYEVLLRGNSSINGMVQNQRHGNTVIAESYILNENNPQSVLVGSSLSFRLKQEYLGDNIFNLSLGGLSAFDGLRLIHKLDRRPKQLIIEINVLKRGASSSFDDEFHFLDVDKTLLLSKSLQSINQPIGIFGEWFGNALIGKVIYKSKLIAYPLIKSKSGLQDGISDQTIENDSLIKQEISNSLTERIDTIAAIRWLGNLRENLKLFNPEQVLIIQVPSGYAGNNSELFKYMFNYLERSDFGEMKVKTWIPDSMDTYTTSDGAHLDAISAKRFALELKNFVERHLE